MRTTESTISATHRPRLVLFIALVVSVTVAMGLPRSDASARPLLSLGPIEVFSFDLILVGAVLLGSATLLFVAGEPRPSLSRFISRALLAYLLYQVLIVVPVALWLESAPVTTIIRGIAVRFDWMLFPALLILFRDGQMRRIASWCVVLAAAALAVWGGYLAVTGGGGYYLDDGGTRYRILSAVVPPLFFWPLALAVSGAVQSWEALALAGLALVGQTLTGFRSALIAGLGAAFVGLITSRRASKAAFWAIPVALLALTVYLLWGAQLRGMYSYILLHLLDFGSANAADRLHRWGLAWDFFRANPFNDYVWSWRRYLVHLTRTYEPHNFVLEVGTNEGLAGLLFYGAMLIAIARAAWRPLWTDNEVRAIACFIVAYVLFAAGNTTWYQDANVPMLVAAVAALAGRLDELDLDQDRLGAPSQSQG